MIQTLAPILILIAIGAALARVRFLGLQFMADLNKLVFWIALPCYIFRSIAAASAPAPATLKLIGVMFAGTFTVTLLGWGVAWAMRVPPRSTGTLIQAGFRGNLAYIGIPVLAYSIEGPPSAQPDRIMATALLVMAPMTVLFNVLAVIVLQSGQEKLGPATAGIVLRSISTNPLLLACVAGIAFALLGIRLPTFADRSIESLGAAAVPIALLCIGGTLATVSFHGRQMPILAAALLKVIAFPLTVWLLARGVGLSGYDLRIPLVLSACPTAAASYIMARQMGGDEALASGAIAVSTMLSAFALAAVLALAS